MHPNNLYDLMTKGDALPIAATWLSLLLFCVNSYLLSRIFVKANVSAWKAWIPLYNFFTFLELGGQSGWLILLSFVPIVGPIVAVIFLCIAAGNIGRNFGKSGWWVLLYLFLQLVWLIVLGFGSSRWGTQARL